MVGVAHGAYFPGRRLLGFVYPVDNDNMGEFIEIVQRFGKRLIYYYFRDNVAGLLPRRLLYPALDSTDRVVVDFFIV
jgi:hypothetical protein